MTFVTFTFCHLSSNTYFHKVLRNEFTRSERKEQTHYSDIDIGSMLHYERRLLRFSDKYTSKYEINNTSVVTIYFLLPPLITIRVVQEYYSVLYPPKN